MKRDMDIIRLLLLQLESGEKPKALEKYSLDEINYNSLLIIEAKLAEGGIFSPESLRELGATVRKNLRGQRVVLLFRMTWAGHDFLDAARDETLWKKAKTTVMKPAASFTFEIIKEFLKNEIRARFGGLG